MGGTAGGGGGGQTSIPASQSGGRFMEVMNNPFMQGGLAMLANNTGREGENGYMAGLGAFNRAQQNNMYRQNFQQQQQRQQQDSQQKMQQLERQMQEEQQRRDLESIALDNSFPEAQRREAYNQLNPQEALKAAFGPDKQTPSMIEAHKLYPNDPKAQAKYISEARLKPDVSITMGATKPLTGSQLKGYQHAKTGKTPPVGSTLNDLMGGEYEVKIDKPTTEAGRMAMAKTSIGMVRELRGELIHQGEMNLLKLAQLSVPGTEMHSKFKDVIASNIYLKTGAAATADEIQSQIDIYKPRAWSDPKTAVSMFERLSEFFELTVSGSGAPSQAPVLQGQQPGQGAQPIQPPQAPVMQGSQQQIQLSPEGQAVMRKYGYE